MKIDLHNNAFFFKCVEQQTHLHVGSYIYYTYRNSKVAKGCLRVCMHMLPHIHIHIMTTYTAHCRPINTVAGVVMEPPENISSNSCVMKRS